jgi:hypothetical protein
MEKRWMLIIRFFDHIGMKNGAAAAVPAKGPANPHIGCFHVVLSWALAVSLSALARVDPASAQPGADEIRRAHGLFPLLSRPDFQGVRGKHWLRTGKDAVYPHLAFGLPDPGSPSSLSWLRLLKSLEPPTIPGGSLNVPP